MASGTRAESVRGDVLHARFVARWQITRNARAVLRDTGHATDHPPNCWAGQGDHDG